MSDTTPRDQLVRQLLNVLCNEVNFPRQAQAALLGLDMRPLADALAGELIERGWRPPARTIATRKELDLLEKLPGAIVRDRDGCLWETSRTAWANPCASGWTYLANMLASDDADLTLPALVLWEPEEGE